MTVFDDVQINASSQHVRRDILVAAWEEDAVLDLLRFLSEQHGETDWRWLGAIACEARSGTLTAYRYGSHPNIHEPVDAAQIASGNIGSHDENTVYLSRTDTTLTEIRSLPPPPADSSQWIIGFWGTRRER